MNKGNINSGKKRPINNKSRSKKIRITRTINRANDILQYVRKLETEGFTISDTFKNQIEKIASGNIKSISKKSYYTLKEKLDRDYVDNVAKFTPENGVRTYLTYKDWKSLNSSDMAKIINKSLKYVKGVYVRGNWEYSKMIFRIAYYANSKELVPGAKNSEYTISKEWDGRPETLSQYITFKNVNLGNNSRQAMITLFEMPAASKPLHDKMIEKSSHEAFLKFVGGDDEEQGGSNNQSYFSWSEDMVEKLEYLMNTSQAWKIAYGDMKRDQSEQAADRWNEMAMKINDAIDECESAKNDNQNFPAEQYIDKIQQHIMNGTDYRSLMTWLNSVIIDAMKNRKTGH